MEVGFNHLAFFEALERRRELEGLSWRQLAKRLALSPSTFSRLARGRRPDVDTLVRLIAWLGMPAEVFMTNTDKTSAPRASGTLEVIADALRSDRAIPSGGAGALEQLMRVAYANLTGVPSTAAAARARRTHLKKS